MNGQLDLFPDDQRPDDPQVDVDEYAAKIAAASAGREVDPNARRVEQLRTVGGGLAAAAAGELDGQSDPEPESAKDRAMRKARALKPDKPFSIHDGPSGAEGLAKDRARALGRTTNDE